MPIKNIDLNSANSLLEFDDSVRQGIPSAVFGVNDSFKAYLVSRIDAPVLVVCKDALTAEAFAETLGDFSGEKAIVIPAKDENLIPSRGFSKEFVYRRTVALRNSENAHYIVAPAGALMQTFPQRIYNLCIEKGCEYSPDKIASGLIAMGYKRVDRTESKGTFAVRGDITDVFPINEELPVRIDFFGDTVESIKTFDPETGKSLFKRESLEVLQAFETVFNENEINTIIERAKKERDSAPANKRTGFDKLVADMETAKETGDLDFFSHYSSPDTGVCLFGGYIPKNAVVIIDDGKRTFENAKLFEADFRSRFAALNDAGGAFSFQESALITSETLKELLKKYREISLSSINSDPTFFNPLKIISPKVSSIADYRLDLREFFSDVNSWISGGYTVLICAGNEKRADNIRYDLSANGIASTLGLKSSQIVGENKVIVITDKLRAGFVLHECKVVVVGSGNLFSKSSPAKKLRLKKQTFFSAPTAGDYCVHETHGIGKVLGNKKITGLEGTKDYVAVEYAGGDILYVPVEEMDVLTRYLGSEKTPKLSKIGGKDFERIKRNAKESIKKMSFDLKKLYEERNAEKGFKFVPDEELQFLFKGAFEFEDTPDQATVDEEVTADMTSGKVMDRLICGDVGFGKTEIAFRAAFLSIINGKQAALLTPTTILSEQHYNTAVKRFKGFGVKIAVLNRFRSDAEQRRILTDLKEGKIDFIIGTHRLISKDVEFKDLGLLILDEEQRFGVEHKERIKLLKMNVDTLTLTATPIPRTLNMSLSGIRSISTINTPPKKRLPVQVYVTEETDMLIRDAVLKEIGRGGQAFILYNRVESIFTFAERIKSILPEIKITVVHGRMDERTLEKSIMGFYNGESDLLISTTIIENGIDLPRANTLIVIDADRLGLSSLYQLKGRVGRSDRLAYAYFTYKREKVISGPAYDRLSAIVEFAEMGSGIKIAMRDLEIRGAGNVLGAEQHGHMDKIGYELYAKLLREELSDSRETDAELDIRVTAYIPESYIHTSSARMDAYKEIAELTSLKEETELISTLTDVYGELPLETENLINVVAVKYLAKKLGVAAVTVRKGETSLKFRDLKAFSCEKIQKAITEFSGRIKIIMSRAPEIRFNAEKGGNSEMLVVLNSFLRFADEK